jgi:hypothetical protein
VISLLRLIAVLSRKSGAIRFDGPVLDMHMRRIKPWIDALEATIKHCEPYAHGASVGLAYLVIAEVTIPRQSPDLYPEWRLLDTVRCVASSAKFAPETDCVLRGDDRSSAAVIAPVRSCPRGR